MSTFRQLRILVLLFILLLVAVSTWLSKARTTDWDRPLVVAIYPINGDNSDISRNYIEGLSGKHFEPIGAFFREEAEHYGLALQNPFEIILAPVLKEIPPAPPADRNLLGVMWWSLKMRYWAWQVARDGGPAADILMFVLYNDPATNPRLAHSLGLQKGLLGVVHAFASVREAGGNRIVIAHELLHTLGATDKYDLATNQPLYPLGYAEPDRQPLLPQVMAEIMAGRVPLTPTQAVQARNLNNVLIGELSALEINWRE